MTKALIAFIALLGLFFSSSSFSDTGACRVSFSKLPLTEEFIFPCSMSSDQLGAVIWANRISQYSEGTLNYISSGTIDFNIGNVSYVSRFYAVGASSEPLDCKFFPTLPRCSSATCPDGSPAPDNQTSQCPIDTKTQKMCSATPTGSTVCIDIEANNLTDAVTSFCSTIGSSAAATDAANNVGSCANGTGVFSLGFNSAPIANAPPNTTACSSSSCLSDAVNGITRETLPDGSTSVTQVTADGTTTSTITSPTGTQKVTTTTPDGAVSIVISSPNGSSSSSTTSPDGSTSTSTTNPDGSSSSSNTLPNGNSTSTNTTASGTTTTTTIINGTKTITINATPPTPPPTPTPPPPTPTTTGANSTDLQPVVDRLTYLAEAARVDATQTQAQLDQSFYANQRLAELVSAGGANLTALNEIKSAVVTSGQTVGSKVDGLGTSLDGIGQKIDQTNSKLDGIGDNLQGIRDGLSGTEFSLSEPSDGELLSSLGLSSSTGVDTLFSPDVHLSQLSAGFNGWLPDYETCPTLPPVELPFVGEFTWNFSMFCDLLTIVGFLVMAAAYVSVPFIIFGGKK